jgi:NitT/TauT family transport system substrate-binding protein
MSDVRLKDFLTTIEQQGVYPSDFAYREAYTLQFVNKGHRLERSSGITFVAAPQTGNAGR